MKEYIWQTWQKVWVCAKIRFIVSNNMKYHNNMKYQKDSNNMNYHKETPKGNKTFWDKERAGFIHTNQFEATSWAWSRPLAKVLLHVSVPCFSDFPSPSATFFIQIYFLEGPSVLEFWLRAFGTQPLR